MKKVSVIVPFHNGLEPLRRCLEALQAQTLPAGDFEIIAVDNGSDDDTSGIKGAFPGVTWLAEPRPGSYSARNRGLRSAAGEIVAFTDADCVPSPTWLQEAVAALGATGATIVGGNIEYLDPPGRALNVCELFEEEVFLLSKHRQLIERLGAAATANVAAYRAAFDRVGLFDPNLKSFGDGEWTARAVAKGEILRYAGSATVYHPRRSTFSEIFRKARRLAGGRTMLMKKKKETAAAFARDFYRYSIFNPKTHLLALKFPKVEGAARRVRIFLLVEAMSLANSFEKTRILLGREAYRG